MVANMNTLIFAKKKILMLNEAALIVIARIDVIQP